MTPIVRPLDVGARGFDTVTRLDAAAAARLRAAGFDFAIRYLGTLDAAERDAIIGAGLGLMAVCYARGSGWSAETGAIDGAAMVQRARAAGLIPGVTLWVDLEGASETVSGTMAYAEACAQALTASGFVAGLYVGAGVVLTPLQLYSLRGITRYWHSLSAVPDVAGVGYCMHQLYPSVMRGGVLVDVDVVQEDYAHRLPAAMFLPG